MPPSKLSVQTTFAVVDVLFMSKDKSTHQIRLKMKKTNKQTKNKTYKLTHQIMCKTSDNFVTLEIKFSPLGNYVKTLPRSNHRILRVCLEGHCDCIVNRVLPMTSLTGLLANEP